MNRYFRPTTLGVISEFSFIRLSKFCIELPASQLTWSLRTNHAVFLRLAFPSLVTISAFGWCPHQSGPFG